MGKSSCGDRSRSAAHSARTTSPCASLRTARSRVPGALWLIGCSRRRMPLATSGVMRGRRSASVGHRLHPHRLPDAGGAHVDGAGRPVFARLLAARLRLRAAVTCAHDQRHRVARLGDAVQVARKGRKAAAVAAHFHAVDPHGSVIVHGLEVQQHAPPAPGGRDRHAAPVPDGVEVVEVLHARELGLRAEGHGDRAAQLARRAGRVPGRCRRGRSRTAIRR